MGLFGLGGDGLGPFTGYSFGRNIEKEFKKEDDLCDAIDARADEGDK